MRSVITQVCHALSLPTQQQRAEAASGGDLAAHNAYMKSWPAMGEIELAQASVSLPKPEQLVVAAWNMERCKRVEESGELLRAAGADIVLATEMDLGCARSGQRHTTRDLAAYLGMGYIYGVEFVELGTGDAYETVLFEHVPNEAGLHGNAILSRYPLLDIALIPLDDDGPWYLRNPGNDGQLRIGGRMALKAVVETANGPLQCVAAHYESASDPVLRAEQTQRLLAAIDPDMATVIGGDLNTAALIGMRASEVLNTPARCEPCFDHFTKGGFDWRTAVTGGWTTRAAPGKEVRYPLLVLDWILVRGGYACDPAIWPALSTHGEYLSDHELITAKINLSA